MQEDQREEVRKIVKEIVIMRFDVEIEVEVGDFGGGEKEKLESRWLIANESLVGF